MATNYFSALASNDIHTTTPANLYNIYKDCDKIGFESLNSFVKPYYDFDGIMKAQDNYDSVVDFLKTKLLRVYPNGDLKISQSIRKVDNNIKVSLHFVVNGYMCLAPTDVPLLPVTDTEEFNTQFESILVAPMKHVFDIGVYHKTQKFRGLYMKKDHETEAFVPFFKEEVNAENYHLWLVQTTKGDDEVVCREAVQSQPTKPRRDTPRSLISFDEYKNTMEYIKDNNPSVLDSRDEWFNYISASAGTMHVMGFDENEVITFLIDWSLTNDYNDEVEIEDEIMKIFDSWNETSSFKFGFIKNAYNKLQKRSKAAFYNILDDSNAHIPPTSYSDFNKVSHSDINEAYRFMMGFLVQIGPSKTKMFFRQPDGVMVEYPLREVAPPTKNGPTIFNIPISTFYQNVIYSAAFEAKCTFVTTEYFPYTEFESPVVKNFNTYKPSPFTCLDSVPKTCKIIETLRNHFEDDLAFNYFVSWASALIKTPTVRLSALILVSKSFGVGKSQIQKMLSNLVGHYNVYNTGSVDSVFNRFNDCIDNKLLINCNEVGSNSKSFREGQEKLKSYVTDNFMSIEAKGKPIKTVANYTHWVFSSNYADCMHIQGGDCRRFSLISVTKPANATSEYWDDFNAMINDANELRAFHTYLMHHEALANPTKPFECALRQENVISSVNDVHKFIYRFVHNDFGDSIYRSGNIQVQDTAMYATAEFLFELYTKEYTNSSFRPSLSKFGITLKTFGLTKKSKRINGEPKKVYVLTKDNVVELFMRDAKITDKKLIDKVTLMTQQGEETDDEDEPEAPMKHSKVAMIYQDE